MLGDFNAFQDPFTFSSFVITNHSFNLSNETFFSLLDTPFHQPQQTPFEPVNICGTGSHSEIPVVYSNLISPISNDHYPQNALGNLNFQPSPSFDTVVPSVAAQTPSVKLPDTVDCESNQSQLPEPDTPIPLNHSESLSPSLSSTDEIRCAWPSCNKVFSKRITYKQHTRSHTKPYQCLFCSDRYAIKPHHDRHVNERHRMTEKYYCRVPTCDRSLAGGGKPFPRMDNCRRHMHGAHRFSKDEARLCDMDEETRRIRAGRNIGRRTAS